VPLPLGIKPWGIKPWATGPTGLGPQMLFPDPRMRSPTAMGAFGLTYACDAVRDALSELEPLLAQSKAAKLLTTHWFGADEGHPIAVNAQTLYSQTINQNLVIASDEACTETSSNLRAASAQLRELLSYQGTGQVQYEPPANSPYRDTTPDMLDKLKPLFIAGAVIIGVVMLIPVVFELTSVVRTARRTSRRTAGYKRRR
jgi:hypothetical protein